MPRETSRAIIQEHQSKLDSLQAGYNSPPSDDPFRYQASDGTRFATPAEMLSYEEDLRFQALAERTFERDVNRRLKA